MKISCIAFILAFLPGVAAADSVDNDSRLAAASAQIHYLYNEVNLIEDHCVPIVRDSETWRSAPRTWHLNNDSVVKHSEEEEFRFFSGVPEAKNTFTALYGKHRAEHLVVFKKKWNLMNAEQKLLYCEHKKEEISSGKLNLEVVYRSAYDLVESKNAENRRMDLCVLTGNMASFLSYERDNGKGSDDALSRVMNMKEIREISEKLSDIQLIPDIKEISKIIYSTPAFDQNSSHKYAFWRCYFSRTFKYSEQIDLQISSAVLKCGQKYKNGTSHSQCVDSEVSTFKTNNLSLLHLGDNALLPVRENGPRKYFIKKSEGEKKN